MTEERALLGLMMDFDLTVGVLLRRAEALFPKREVVTRTSTGLHRYTYLDLGSRARKLAVSLKELGLKRGDRVATLCWNHHQHVEAYYGIPLAGGVLHTLNARLHESDLAAIVTHAGDRYLIVDEQLLPVYERFANEVSLENVLVVADHPSDRDRLVDFETLLRNADENHYVELSPDEREAAAMCYTSGTTGGAKGVLYSHRSLVLHSLMSCLPGTLDIRETDTVLVIPPLFHVNGWGFPYTCALVGANQVFPGAHPDPEDLLNLLEQERVTITGCVPTVGLALLDRLDRNPDQYDLSALRSIIVAASAAPRAMIEGFQERHGLTVVHAWGMTELSPTGCVSRLRSELLEESSEIQYDYRTKQGLPVPLVEIRARGEDSLVPWDGATTGELEVRGPWVAGAYYGQSDAADRFTEDGWFRTGDIATIDPMGYVEIRDRAKDLIKSGGEWISSVALETALIGHPAVSEAAVIAVPHEKWGERPLAVVVLKEGATATADELREILEGRFAKWWLPDVFEFVDEIPKTSIGKYQKSVLRERYAEAFSKERVSSAGSR